MEDYGRLDAGSTPAGGTAERGRRWLYAGWRHGGAGEDSRRRLDAGSTPAGGTAERGDAGSTPMARRSRGGLYAQARPATTRGWAPQDRAAWPQPGAQGRREGRAATRPGGEPRRRGGFIPGPLRAPSAAPRGSSRNFSKVASPWSTVAAGAMAPGSYGPRARGGAALRAPAAAQGLLQELLHGGVALEHGGGGRHGSWVLRAEGEGRARRSGRRQQRRGSYRSFSTVASPWSTAAAGAMAPGSYGPRARAARRSGRRQQRRGSYRSFSTVGVTLEHGGGRGAMAPGSYGPRARGGRRSERRQQRRGLYRSFSTVGVTLEHAASRPRRNRGGRHGSGPTGRGARAGRRSGRRQQRRGLYRGFSTVGVALEQRGDPGRGENRGERHGTWVLRAEGEGRRRSERRQQRRSLYRGFSTVGVALEQLGEPGPRRKPWRAPWHLGPTGQGQGAGAQSADSSAGACT
jgi:hypothetical protein